MPESSLLIGGAILLVSLLPIFLITREHRQREETARRMREAEELARLDLEQEARSTRQRPSPAAWSRSAPTTLDPLEEKTPLSPDASPLQVPAFATGAEREVVGESFNQPALQAAARGSGADGARRRHVMAVLELEPNNPYDPNAIRVAIGGRTVGHIPRDDTHEYRPFLRALAARGVVASCRAEITGGWDQGPGSRGHFGIVLNAADPLQESDADEPTLPVGERVTVVGEEAHQEALEKIFAEAGGDGVLAELRSPAGVVEVLIDGERVGELTAKMSERFLPLVGAAATACGRATTPASLSRGKKKLEVTVLLPDPADVL